MSLVGVPANPFTTPSQKPYPDSHDIGYLAQHIHPSIFLPAISYTKYQTPPD
jgi:hypothetical protein